MVNRTEPIEVRVTPERKQKFTQEMSTVVFWASYINADKNKIGRTLSRATSWYPDIKWVYDEDMGELAYYHTSEAEQPWLDLIPVELLLSLENIFIFALPDGLMMNRRTFIAASITGLTSVSAGCSTIQSGEKEDSYEFSIYNDVLEEHSFRVEIGARSRENGIYDETIELGAGKGNEHIPIDSAPVSISVTIDGEATWDYPWPGFCSRIGNCS